MPYKNKEDKQKHNKNNYIKNRGYKKANHKGFFDGLANKAEWASSFLTRTKAPPNYLLNLVKLCYFRCIILKVKWQT